ncbi:MAG TPA: CocE/NonD family hydrolase [Chitinophagaceae bacterium]|nr:CocE/NonD family hydrolase [Chitinophagaceae bacterium]
MKNLLLLFTCCMAIVSHAQITYTRQEVMIPMRDGIKLHTVIFTPGNVSEPVPILVERTPYGADHAQSPDKSAYLKDMAAGGYIFVFQDIRGRYKSEGQFVMNRPILDKPGTVDESTDAWDAVDWLVKNVKNNNGKVGQLGISYLGWTTLVAAARPHPALVAASEQATPADMFLGDDFHHNGAFRLSYGFDYSFMEEASKVDTLFPFDDYDLYNWFLKLGPLSNANAKYLHGMLPTWNNFTLHPNYDTFWQKQSALHYVGYPRIPMLHVGGVWDQEDINGPQIIYNLQEKLDTNHRNYICLGPWNHGQWAGGNVTHLASYDMGSNTAQYFQQHIQKKWFDHWLKGKDDGDFPEATVFETGSNQWKTYSTWPPKEATIKRLYTAANGKVSFNKPAGDGYDEYISDPARPVPYRQRPIEQTYGPNSRWYTWLAEDQRFADGRPDVATWQSDTLTQDVTVTGSIIAHLFAGTTGSDADWVVKLIDVYPGKINNNLKMSGYELMVASEVLRGRFRKSFETPLPVTPGKAEEYTVDMHQVDHTFLKGHRIMIQVQSSWFPCIDMNPQKFVPNIFEAKATDYQKATQRIYRGGNAATYIELPVME